MTRSTCTSAATGRWAEMLTELGKIDPGLLDGKGRPCPICKEGTDRFTFDDKEGRGTWICRQCPARPGKDAGAGDGMALLQAVTGWDFQRAAGEIERFLGLPSAALSNGARPSPYAAAPLAREPASALPAIPQEEVQLLRLPAVATDAVHINPEGPTVCLKEKGRGGKIVEVEYIKEAAYRYTASQGVWRLMPVAGGKKRFHFLHLKGTKWLPGAGPEPWPVWREVEAAAAAKANPGRWLLETEGEKTSDITREGGLACISQPGHAHSLEQIKPRYKALQAAGIAGIVYLADEDEPGLKRAQTALGAAAAVGLSLVVLPASEVWPSLPEGGSIDNGDGTAAERVAALESALATIGPQEWRTIWSEWCERIDPREVEQTTAATGASEPAAAAFSGQEKERQLSYSELISAMLAAVMAGQDDEAMKLRAETIGRFRRSDAQIEAALLKLHTELEIGKRGSAPPESLDLSRISGMDWLVEGFIPDNDLTLIWGDAGSGKTTAALAAANAVLSGTGLLDHTHPTPRRSVLFIASDSGAQPLRATMQEMDMADLPEVRQGPDQRFFLWAADRDQGMTAWCADLMGCTRLLQFIRMRHIGLVIIDSCKAVCSGAGIDYTNNQTVTSLLTYFKEVICPHAAVVWLNHDGTAKGAAAGAKAWREIPSMVHRICRDDLADGNVANERRRWIVTKSRMGPCREFDYQVKEGSLNLCPHQQVIGNCLAHVVDALSEAFHLHKREKLARSELIERICLAGGPSRKTLDNTLSSATRAKHPEICRAGRGYYRLAPRTLELLKGPMSNGKEITQTPVSDWVLSSSRQVPVGNLGTFLEFPGKNDGNSLDPSAAKGSDQVPSRSTCAPIGEEAA